MRDHRAGQRVAPVGGLHGVSLSGRARDRAAISVPCERKTARTVAPGAVGARERIARSQDSRDRRKRVVRRWRSGDDRCWARGGRGRAAVVGPGHDHADRVADVSVGQRVGVLVISGVGAALAVLVAVLPLVVERRIAAPVAVGRGQRVPRRRGPRDRRQCVVRRGSDIVFGDLGELGAGLLDVRVRDLDLVVAGLGVRVVGGQRVLGRVLLVAWEQTVGHHVLNPAVVAPVDACGLRAAEVRRAAVVELDREALDAADLLIGCRSLGRTGSCCRRCWWRSPRSDRCCSGSRFCSVAVSCWSPAFAPMSIGSVV